MKKILIYIFLLGLMNCSDSETYKIQFDDVNGNMELVSIVYCDATPDGVALTVTTFRQ